MSYSLDVSAQTDTVKVFVGGEVFDGDANGERVAWATVRLRSAADSTHQFSLFVVERDTESVELHLAAQLEGFTVKSLLYPFVEVAHLLLVVGVGEGEHGALVRHRDKVVGKVAAHALRRAVGVMAFGMSGFQFLEPVHHLVKLLVADDRGVEYVVAVVMLMG